MKRLLVIIIFCSQALAAQDVTYLGIDFSHGVYVGQFTLDDARSDAEVLRDKYFDQWNQLIFQEPKRYNVATNESTAHCAF